MNKKKREREKRGGKKKKKKSKKRLCSGQNQGYKCKMGLFFVLFGLLALGEAVLYVYVCVCVLNQ